MIRVNTHRGTFLVPIEDIVYFSHADKYVTIHCVSDGKLKEVLVEKSLLKLVEEYPEFTKVNKNLAVRLHEISSRTRADGDTQNYITLFRLGDDVKLPISRRMVATVNNQLRLGAKL